MVLPSQEPPPHHGFIAVYAHHPLGIFGEPVPDDVPDYDGHLALIGTERMDLGTMKKQSRRYKSVAALRDDLTMMLRNW